MLLLIKIQFVSSLLCILAFLAYIFLIVLMNQEAKIIAELQYICI